jgi:AcrR family transcriptional regulator
MHERGLVGCTTKEIAREAGVAEGLIYRHFADKYELCLEAMADVFSLPAVLVSPPDKPARDVLLKVVRAYFDMLVGALPMLSGIVGHPDLAELQRRRGEHKGGSMQWTRALTAYLQDKLGPSATPPEILARMLLGTTFHHAYLSLTLGPEALDVSWPVLSKALVDAVLAAAGVEAKVTA